MAVMLTWYVCYCPAGAQCGKHGKRLGSFEDDSSARQCIYNHLTRSSHHNATHEDAQQAAQTAALDMEDWPEEVQLPPQAAQAQQAAQAHLPPPPVHDTQPPTWNATTRSVPYSKASTTAPPPRLQLVQTAEVRDARELQMQPAYDVPSLPSMAFLLAAAVKSEQAARASARIARQAAQAFDDEAEHFSAAARLFKQALDRQ